jgi:hypothetical protein
MDTATPTYSLLCGKNLTKAQRDQLLAAASELFAEVFKEKNDTYKQGNGMAPMPKTWEKTERTSRIKSEEHERWTPGLGLLKSLQLL